MRGMDKWQIYGSFEGERKAKRRAELLRAEGYEARISYIPERPGKPERWFVSYKVPEVAPPPRPPVEYPFPEKMPVRVNGANGVDEVWFEEITEPPITVKEDFRRMIPTWAWNAMKDDVKKIFKEELPKKTSKRTIERLISRRWESTRREALVPKYFIKDITNEVYEELMTPKPDGRISPRCKPIVDEIRKKASRGESDPELIGLLGDLLRCERGMD